MTGLRGLRRKRKMERQIGGSSGSGGRLNGPPAAAAAATAVADAGMVEAVPGVFGELTCGDGDDAFAAAEGTTNAVTEVEVVTDSPVVAGGVGGVGLNAIG